VRMKLIQEDFDKIEQLVNCALWGRSKRDAESYINQLQFMHRTGGYGGYANIVFGELVAQVQSAAGQVQDKERLCGFTRTSLYKLSGQIVKDADGGNEDE